MTNQAGNGRRGDKKKRRAIFVALVLVLAGVGAVWWIDPEPTYQGKKLRDWAEAASENPNAADAKLAVEKITPRAVTYYGRVLRKREPVRWRLYRGFWRSLPASLQDTFAEPLPPDVNRIEAALMLRFLGAPARKAEPALIVGAHDPSEAVRQSSLEALAEVEPDVALVLPLLVGACQDPFYGVRRVAVESLERFGPAAQSALPTLTERLTDASSRVRACAAGAVWAVGRQTNVALRVLVETFRNPDPTTRALSALYCGRLGPAAKSMVPTLVEALRDSKDVREQAEVALRRINPDAADRALAR